jgi:hypothetical protein
VSLDGGESYEEDPIFIYGGEGAGSFYRDAGNAEVAYNEYIFEVPQAAGQEEVVFAWHYSNPGPVTAWWAIDDVMVTAPGEEPAGGFVRGDVDASGQINITDAIFLLGYLFQGTATPPCIDAADVDDLGAGAANITDAIFLLGWLFQGTDKPPAPAPAQAAYEVPGDCGPDPTGDDGMDCAAFEPCP